MNVTLYRQEIDEATFPELQQLRGHRGLQARALAGSDDPRLASSASGVQHVLLVVFRLPAAIGDPPEWWLSFDVIDEYGSPRPVNVLLRNPPMDGNVAKRPIADPGETLPAGLMYRGAFWVNLDPLLATAGLSAGSVLRLRYGKSEPAEVMIN